MLLWSADMSATMRSITKTLPLDADQRSDGVATGVRAARGVVFSIALAVPFWTAVIVFIAY